MYVLCVLYLRGRERWRREAGGQGRDSEDKAEKVSAVVLLCMHTGERDVGIPKEGVCFNFIFYLYNLALLPVAKSCPHFYISAVVCWLLELVSDSWLHSEHIKSSAV